MNWWLPHNFDKKRDVLQKRAQIIKQIRKFFDAQDFIEVDTPILQIAPCMDVHIHGFGTDLLDIDREHKRRMYLHSSPEFDMKKLLVAGMTKIYQICHVFRNAEGSNLHRHEFLMIEWYRVNADYNALMNDCVDILQEVAKSIGIEHYRFAGKVSNPFIEWQKISVVEAFAQYAGIDLCECLGNRDIFAARAVAIDVRVIESDSWEDIFHAIMAEKIEPYLGEGAPTILYDYPISMAALSRVKPDDLRYAERFELYVCGVELANAYCELTDAAEQRSRYEVEMALKAELYGETYPADEELFAALEHGMPESAGIALGLDRLVMLACGVDDIGDVLWVG